MSGSDTPECRDGIAITGMSCRFPGARNVDEYWRNLRDGVESVTFFSEEELLSAGVDRAVVQDPDYVKARSVLKDVDLFDASFFGFTSREAEITDPQHRVFLECAWEALESAGCDPASFNGLIGVYAGSGACTYLINNLITRRDVRDAVGNFQLLLGNEKDYLASRVSYKLNLKGPSVVVQTACSTSLVAVHLACESLLTGECDLALAGGVSITLPQQIGYRYQEAGILSPDGHCRAFDADAKGTIFGSGAGAIVLKR
jgi:acyl transferase domain-containing protein